MPEKLGIVAAAAVAASRKIDVCFPGRECPKTLQLEPQLVADKSHKSASERRKIRHVPMPEKLGIVAAAAVAASRKIDVCFPGRKCPKTLQPVIDYFGAKFWEAYVPGKKVTIEESLVSIKWRLSFRQYIPTKQALYGVKI